MGRLNWNKPTAPEPESGEEPAPEGWEVPAPTDSGADPWLAPGSLRPSAAPPVANPNYPFQCRTCGTSLRIEGAYASGGEIYCIDCRPRGAVSSLDLPAGDPLRFEDPRTRELPGFFVLRLLRQLWRRLRGDGGRIGW